MTPQTAKAPAVSASLSSNRAFLKRVFENCHDISFDHWSYGADLGYEALSVYCRTLVPEDRNPYVKQTLHDLTGLDSGAAATATPSAVGSYFQSGGVAKQGFAVVRELSEVVDLVLQGCVVLFFDQWDGALVYHAPEIEKRPVSEPVNEPVVHGPREGTVEDLGKNLGLLRQRIPSSDLKIEWISAGRLSKTSIAFCYLEPVVAPDLLAEFRRRIAGLERYDVPETSYVEDWIQDSAYSPFPQFRYTERTDTATAALMEGKIAVLVDHTPSILIAPAYLVDFIGSSEDYYVRTVYASMIRLLRLLAFSIALTLPSIYIALSTFHSELIPTVLLLAILDTREGIPFSAFVEALIMEISFELLREAGIRLPRPVGPAVSIVGALVIGQAAIMAKIASPIMVIVVALTGIASFAIPNYGMGIALRILRFPYMVAAAALGGFGLMIAMLLTLLHLTSLHTLGQPYLTSLAPFRWKDMRDIVVRIPLKQLLRSPRSRRLSIPSNGRKDPG
ncbi:spore germination protein [Cohnella zeiphila]|uniref:spore germination protein n=1 Tax=Cohnella zeiphila TaxID=2761120 RepID=UPI001EE31AA4|nr:spore germination protein [Cohnella zeiphila]